MNTADWLQVAATESVAARGKSTPNPPVGAVIVAADGTLVGRGHTQPAGGPHAEIVAMTQAGSAAYGATAYVTLEPCNHTGRTGPCSQALIDAGVAAVVYAVADPNPTAAGGAKRLREAGIGVTGPVDTASTRTGGAPEIAWPLTEWLFRQRHGRPMVTLKFATTIDGRIAAPDGTSQWITGPGARDRVHFERSQLDAIVVGTGTVITDNPTLTARTGDGARYPHQPLRVVLGNRELPADAHIFNNHAPTVRVRSHDPLAALRATGDALSVQVEGGPRTLGAFVEAGLTDRVHCYLAPTVLGAGAAAIDAPSVRTLTEATPLQVNAVQQLGDDLLITLIRRFNSDDPLC